MSRCASENPGFCRPSPFPSRPFLPAADLPSPPVHLYVHIPFCRHICPYCAFYKHTPGRLANRAFVDALLAEARQQAESHRPRFETVYFGGGTPTLLSSSHLARLCSGLAGVLDFSTVREWTVEANPATFDLAKAGMLREQGVTRISLGTQSFQAPTLATLGRDHSPDDAIAGFRILREAGVANLNVDLMFSVPGQSLDDWRRDIETVSALAPEHVSAYNLTYEEDTEFLERHRRGELDADEDRDAALFHAAAAAFEESGFRHYEISNYAKPGFESLHNRAYWLGEDYLGLGPGAVSTVAGMRWTNLPDTAAYVAALTEGRSVRTSEESLSAEDRRLEAIGLRLRTAEGLPLRYIEDRDRLLALLDEGLLVQRDGHLLLTSSGKALADPIAGMLA